MTASRPSAGNATSHASRNLWSAAPRTCGRRWSGMPTGSAPDGIRSELSMELRLLGPCPRPFARRGGAFQLRRRTSPDDYSDEDADLAPARWFRAGLTDACSRLSHLPLDVDGLAASVLVDHVGVGVEDRRDLVAELLGDLSDREALLGDEERRPGVAQVV